jgi:phenylpyruvate tautomerase PptA (4-oxalocrotonate tautomerase family)
MHALTTQEVPKNRSVDEGETTMPLVHIDLQKGKTSAFRQAVSDIVYHAVIEAVNVPTNDRFQVITEHEKEDLIYDPTYLGIQRTDEILFIQITLNVGRTVDLKRALYQTIADRLHEQLSVRKEDVFISLVEVTKENWSYGNGIAQYA